MDNHSARSAYYHASSFLYKGLINDDGAFLNFFGHWASTSNPRLS